VEVREEDKEKEEKEEKEGKEEKGRAALGTWTSVWRRVPHRSRCFKPAWPVVQPDVTNKNSGS
jgi:hypothetical protein